MKRLKEIKNHLANQFFTVLLLSLIVSSCKQEGSKAAVAQEPEIKKKEKIDIALRAVEVDSISIRALEYDGVYWFAASKGRYGIIDAQNATVSFMDSIQEPKNLEFRSIAVGEETVFILNAGGPAYLFEANENDYVQLYTEQGEGVFYDSMKFWENGEGIIFGDPTAQDDVKCLSILKTTDFGKTWNKVSCDKLPEFIDGEAGFAASNSNISIVGDQVWIATGGAAARVLHSLDRGATWEVQETPIVAGAQMTGIFAMDFYDENVGVIVGGDWSDKEKNTQNLAMTRDGGASWELISEGSGPGYCSDILFIPNTDGKELLAVGTPGIWWSGDQGVTWKQISEEGFYTAAMESKNKGVLTGYAKAAVFEISESKN
ncbi:hypothetical protein BST97_02285 [Nonlabens spongiae]|uniref:Oxidoreductase n=1 Tax=Nonlabens spongiae TaxID=331648 RepID=A0A1W6MNY7_9FLAO|nr:hypothetical protein [Nonlabens spongiae]ARN79333.1 hypothetical protein BST97_02285 [Nonlabens spongiae]